jgi:acyl-coenzyme A thioesterase PaaI-like protein
MQEAEVRDLVDMAIGDGRHEFGSFFLSRLFGRTVSYEADARIVSLDVKPFMYNPQGSLHGGVLATALDISMGHLLKHRLPVAFNRRPPGGSARSIQI